MINIEPTQVKEHSENSILSLFYGIQSQETTEHPPPWGCRVLGAPGYHCTKLAALSTLSMHNPQAEVVTLPTVPSRPFLPSDTKQ